MLRALAYLKTKGFCHRDIKPQNILVDIKDHRLVICDFGSAKKIEHNESSVAYICSRYYRAPELILGDEYYNVEIDMWSIGCVMAELFSGEPLFCGKSSKDQFQKIMYVLGTPTQEQIRAMCPTVNAKLPNVVGHGLKKCFKNIDPLFIDFLEKILVYEPKLRIHPADAMLHPYFDDLRSQKLTINSRPVTDLFCFSKDEFGDRSHLISKLTPQWYLNSEYH